MKSIKTILLSLTAIFGIILPSTLILAQNPPICLNPSGHLIWPNQTKNYIPYLSGKDTVSNSPIYIKDGNIGIGITSPLIYY